MNDIEDYRNTNHPYTSCISRKRTHNLLSEFPSYALQRDHHFVNPIAGETWLPPGTASCTMPDAHVNYLHALGPRHVLNSSNSCPQSVRFWIPKSIRHQHATGTSSKSRSFLNSRLSSNTPGTGSKGLNCAGETAKTRSEMGFAPDRCHNERVCIAAFLNCLHIAICCACWFLGQWWLAWTGPRAVPGFGKGAPFCLLHQRTTDLVAAGTGIVLKPESLLRSSSLIYLKHLNHVPGEVAQVFFLCLKDLKHPIPPTHWSKR